MKIKHVLLDKIEDFNRTDYKWKEDCIVKFKNSGDIHTFGRVDAVIKKGNCNATAWGYGSATNHGDGNATVVGYGNAKTYGDGHATISDINLLYRTEFGQIMRGYCVAYGHGDAINHGHGPAFAHGHGDAFAFPLAITYGNGTAKAEYALACGHGTAITESGTAKSLKGGFALSRANGRAVSEGMGLMTYDGGFAIVLGNGEGYSEYGSVFIVKGKAVVKRLFRNKVSGYVFRPQYRPLVDLIRTLLIRKECYKGRLSQYYFYDAWYYWLDAHPDFETKYRPTIAFKIVDNSISFIAEILHYFLKKIKFFEFIDRL